MAKSFVARHIHYESKSAPSKMDIDSGAEMMSALYKMVPPSHSFQHELHSSQRDNRHSTLSSLYSLILHQ